MIPHMASKPKILLSICTLLCIVNIVVIFYFGLFESRLIKLISLICLFVFFIMMTKTSSKTILVFFYSH